MLDERWKNVKKIPKIQSHHFFITQEKDTLITGKTSLKSTLLPTQVFKLSVDDVYIDSPSDGEDGVLENSETNVVGTKPKVENIKSGTFVLVEFTTMSTKQSIKYKYAALYQSDIEDDGEVKVMCMRVVKDSGRLFKVDEKDVSYVNFTQILSVLPQPYIKRVRNSVFYEFKGNVDVFEIC